VAAARPQCHLCGAEGPLCRSHIVPKFVGDWLRATNATGRLRDTAAPDRLIEDLPWRHMLCAACEQRFAQIEAETCARIFMPLHERQSERFRYGPTFMQFAVSVLWRSLVLMRVEGRLGQLGELTEIGSAERVWREFLLGYVGTVAPHDVHAFNMDAPPPHPTLRELPPISGDTCSARSGSLRFNVTIACRLGEKLGHQGHRQFPVLGFLANLSPSACRQLVELRLPVVVGNAPSRLDPSSLLQPEERRIQRALIQVEKAFRHLEDPLGESETVLRSHRVERPQHHEIEGALQYFS